jgi:hypothetical protein
VGGNAEGTTAEMMKLGNMVLILVEQRQTLVEILAYYLDSGKWSDDIELRRRFSGYILTHDEWVWVINKLETEFKKESLESSIRYKIASILPTLKHVKWTKGEVTTACDCATCERLKTEPWLCPDHSVEECSSRAQEREEDAAKISYDRKEEISCHQCGANNQTYWYILQHIDKGIMKVLCTKCMGAGGFKEPRRRRND